MGHNATVVVMLDALNEIEHDENFGKKMSDSILMFNRLSNLSQGSSRYRDISSGGHAAAATVVDVHHADYLTPILVGGNYGRVIPIQVYMNPNEAIYDTNVRVLKEMADVLGYRISKKPTQR